MPESHWNANFYFTYAIIFTRDGRIDDQKLRPCSWSTQIGRLRRFHPENGRRQPCPWLGQCPLSARSPGHPLLSPMRIRHVEDTFGRIAPAVTESVVEAGSGSGNRDSDHSSMSSYPCACPRQHPSMLGNREQG